MEFWYHPEALRSPKMLNSGASSQWLLPRLAISSQVMLCVVLCNDYDDPLYLGDDGKTFYCGANIRPEKSGSGDAYCGPKNGPQCNSCQRGTFTLAPGDLLMPGHIVPVIPF